MWSRFVHTGEYYGVFGQTVAGVASAAGVMLVWTGISLVLRRFAARNVRRRKRRSLQEEEPASIGAHVGTLGFLIRSQANSARSMLAAGQRGSLGHYKVIDNQALLHVAALQA